ncbi:MAG: glycosyltransferase family 9 protein [Armatimonadetes bacterium]|nr:glycosyltransferase family 9 protein [Armatimonadota bacterium]
MKKLDTIFGIIPDYLLSLFTGFQKITFNDSSKIILVKMFGLGSLTLIKASLNFFKYSPEQIILITFRENEEFARFLGFKKIYTLRNNTFFNFIIDYFKTILIIIKQKPHFIIDFEFYSRTTSIFTKLIVLFNKSYSLGFWDKDFPRNKGYSDTMPFSYATHITNIYKLAFKKIGLNNSLNSSLTINQKRESDLILINPNASELALGRKWDALNFAELIKKINQLYPQINFILTGSRNEYSANQKIIEKTKEINPKIKIENSAGIWSAEDFCQKISTCGIFITNDSGPLHLASFTQTPTVSIWGPGSPYQFGPMDKKYHKSCMYIRGEDAGGYCKKTFPCIKSILVDNVLNAFQLLYEELSKNKINV